MAQNYFITTHVAVLILMIIGLDKNIFNIIILQPKNVNIAVGIKPVKIVLILQTVYNA